MNSVKRLESLINAPRDELVYSRLNQAAQERASVGDAKLLRTAKRVMPDEEWGNLGASILARMGRPPAGAQDPLALAPGFSPSSFTTNWNRLSPDAKNLLFGADTEGSTRAAVESFVRVAQSQKNLGRLANVSGSGAHSNMFWMARDMLMAAAAGQFGHLGAAVAAGGGAYALAKAMMSQPFAKFAYDTLPRSSAALRQAAPGQAMRVGEAGRASTLGPAGGRVIRRETVTPPSR